MFARFNKSLPFSQKKWQIKTFAQHCNLNLKQLKTRLTAHKYRSSIHLLHEHTHKEGVFTTRAHVLVADVRVSITTRVVPSMLLLCFYNSCCAFFFSLLCNTLCSRIKAKATKPLNWRMRFLLLICACSHACVCVSVCVQQERMFLSVSNYIFTVIFVGEMMIKVTITVNIFWISTPLQSHFLASKEAIFFAGGDQNGFHSHFTPQLIWLFE